MEKEKVVDRLVMSEEAWRWLFAGMAMQGILSDSNTLLGFKKAIENDRLNQGIACHSIALADNLIAELKK